MSKFGEPCPRQVGREVEGAIRVSHKMYAGRGGMCIFVKEIRAVVIT